MSTICPICGKDDAIQKVSSVVSTGVQSGSFSGPSGSVINVDGKWGYSGGYTSLHGQTSTDLAKLLDAPVEPRKPNGPRGNGCLINLIIWWVILMLYTFAGMFIGGAVAWLLSYISEDFVGVIGLFPILAAYFAYVTTKHFNDEQKKKDEPRYSAEVDKWEIEVLQPWKKATEIYNRAFYCHRDDLVFDPETQETRPPQKMSEFLGYPG